MYSFVLSSVTADAATFKWAFGLLIHLQNISLRTNPPWPLGHVEIHAIDNFAIANTWKWTWCTDDICPVQKHKQYQCWSHLYFQKTEWRGDKNYIHFLMKDPNQVLDSKFNSLHKFYLQNATKTSLPNIHTHGIQIRKMQKIWFFMAWRILLNIDEWKIITLIKLELKPTFNMRCKLQGI